MDMVLYGLLKKKIESSITGIGNVQVIQPDTLRFTNKQDGSTFDVQLPYFLTHQEILWVEQMFDLLKVNATTNDLEYDGIPVNNIMFDNRSNFDANTNKLYVDIQTNTVYRYDGSTYIEIGGSSSGDKFTRTDLTTVALGGFSAGSSVAGMTAKDVLEAVLFPYQQPTVSFNITPSTLIYEKNLDTVTSLAFSITVTKKSNNVTAIQIYAGNTLVTTIPVTLTSGSITKNYTYACNITADTTLKVVAVDGASNGQATKTMKFVDVMYKGYGSDTTLTKIYQAKGNYTFSGITCVNDSVIFKYPQSYGNLTSILDSNGFENLSAFTVTTETINGVAYNVYTSGRATLNGFSYTFKF